MTFDAKAFNKSKMEHRTQGVEVHALSEFFAEGVEPVWTVRSMTHAEMSKIRDVNQRDSVISTAIAALAGDSKEKAEMIKMLIGDVDDVPDRTRVRIEMLTLCSVSPTCDRQTAVKLAQHFPAIFETLTTIITDLTDKGSIVAQKKPVSSGSQEK